MTTPVKPIPGLASCPFAAIAGAQGPPSGHPTIPLSAKADAEEGTDGEQTNTDQESDVQDVSLYDGEAWQENEAKKRAKLLPRLQETEKLLIAEGGPGRLGQLFYEQLANLAPEVYDLFKGMSVEHQAIRLGEIVLELIRLVSLETKLQFQQEMETLAMRHVDYGAERQHGRAFKKCLLIAIRTFAIREGGDWNRHHASALSWVYNLAFNILFTNIERFQPKVEDVRASFQKLLSKAADYKSTATRTATGLKSTSAQSGKATATATASLNAQRRKKWNKEDECIRASLFVAPDEEPEALDPTTIALTEVGEIFLRHFLKVLPKQGKGFNFGEDFPIKIGRILDLIVSSATRPKELQQKLRGMATRHIEMGVTPEHLPCFQQALFTVLQEEIGDEVWARVESSWSWLFKIVSDVFTKQLEHWKETVKYVDISWGKLMQTGTAESVALIFFTTLIQQGTAEIQGKFKRPVTAQAKMFGKALEIIVGSAKQNIDEQLLDDIALRHVKYDLKPRMFDIFGKILIRSLADQSKEIWCPEMDRAWENLYETVSQIFVSLLSRSSNLMTRGFAKCSIRDVKTALAASPRKRRVRDALIFGDEDLKSPLLCALRDGHTDIARLLIADITCIRADRKRYYYGLDELWARCDDIFTIMCVHSPSLIEPLLDGHLWVSATTSRRFRQVSASTSRGFRQVNIWHKYIYGDPETLEDVFRGPLGDLVDKVPTSHLHVFSHPVITSIVDLKWKYFARNRILLLNVTQFLQIIFFEIHDQNMHRADRKYLRNVALVLWMSSSTLLLGYTMFTIIRQIQFKQFIDIYVSKNGTVVKLPRVLADSFPWSRIILTVMSIFLGLRDALWNKPWDTNKQLAAFVGFLHWIQLFEFVKMTHKLSATLFMARKLLANAFRFLMVLIVWIEATGVAIYHLAPKKYLECTSYPNSPHQCKQDSYGGRGFDTAYDLFASTLGHESELLFYSGPYAALVRILFTGALWVGVVPILNLLVASMVTTYSEAEAHTQDLAVRARASLVLTVESTLGKAFRQKYFNKVGFDQPLEFSDYDKGPPGGVTTKISSLELETHPCYMRRLDCVKRFSGSTDENEPWPPHEVSSGAHDESASLMALNAAVSGLTQQFHADMSSIRSDVAELKHLINDALGVTSQASGDIADTTITSDGVFADEKFNEAKGFGMVDDTDADEESRPKVYSSWAALKDAAEAAGSGSCILAVEGIVYDVGSFVSKHPGGTELIKTRKGTDATSDFQKHANVTRAYQQLLKLPRVGEVAEAE